MPPRAAIVDGNGMTLTAPTLSCHRIDDLVARVTAGHDAAHALRTALVERTVVIRGVDATGLAALERTLASCGASSTLEIADDAANAIVLGPRATRRERARATARGLPEITLEGLGAICAVRAGFGDPAVAPPLALDDHPGLALVMP
jgi:hypothetical protein